MCQVLAGRTVAFEDMGGGNKMIIQHTQSKRGIAIILVLVAITVLGALAGGFAYSMKIEMRLAQNHNNEAEMEWLGRSGVELAKYVLAQQLTQPGGRFDSLNQKWAGGQGVTNEGLAEIELENVQLGSGAFSVKIIDQERFFNINVADEEILQRAMNMVGVDGADATAISDCILDWRDTDDATHLKGAESDDYYLRQQPPYYAKNGPIDDLTELMLIKGITPEMYWGPSGTNYARAASASFSTTRLDQSGVQTMDVGLKDLFTPISGRLININTASAAVLQLIPGFDANVATGIIQARAGPDGVEGNDDDTPFHNVGELINVPGLDKGAVSRMSKYFAVLSATFEVQVTVDMGTSQRTYVAMVRRNNQRDVQTLYFYWR